VLTHEAMPQLDAAEVKSWCSGTQTVAKSRDDAAAVNTVHVCVAPAPAPAPYIDRPRHTVPCMHPGCDPQAQTPLVCYMNEQRAWTHDARRTR
jgi:hypothetical protein